MPPGYAATLRVPASVSEKRLSRSSAVAARVLEVPQPGDKDENLLPAEDLIDRRELPGETDGLAYADCLRRDIEAVDPGRPYVGLEQQAWR